MDALVGDGHFKESLIRLYEDNLPAITGNDPASIAGLRQESFEIFRNLGIPTQRNEDWKNTDLGPVLARDYIQPVRKPNDGAGIDSLFICQVHDLETDQVAFLNGWHVKSAESLEKLPEGVIVSSLAVAMREHPRLVERHYARYATPGQNIFQAMNTAFAQDGLFIYVPDGVVIEKPIQLISIIHHEENLLLQSRNLIILGKNSGMTLVHCDDSTNHQASLNNAVTEVFLGDNARMTHYKLQNLNDASTLLNSTYFHLNASSHLTTFALTFNGGLIRNYSSVRLAGEGASADVYGLYLMDKKQRVDNRVFVDHAVPHCNSSELFKGILDDEAQSVFNGHVMVRHGAQKTNAYQNNRNILLTDKAQAYSRPFLEIFADDVKCSHGATVGQLDNQSLFYLRSRGICMASARLLLMYAFAAEVINHISIQPLKGRIDEMVRQRLKGELHICDRCVLHCDHHQKEITFDIDYSKI